MKDIKLSEWIATCQKMEDLNPENPCKNCQYEADFCELIYGAEKRLPRAINSVGKVVEKKFGEYTLKELSTYCKTQQKLCYQCKFKDCCYYGFQGSYTPNQINDSILNTDIYIKEEKK